MVLDGLGKYGGYKVDGVSGNFWVAPDGIKASTPAFHTVFSLTRTAGGLWSLCGLQRILLRRKPLC